MDIKEQLYQQCVLYVKKREATIATIMTSNQKALTSETKSSAGDKHETGRAMLQLEMEKAGQQLHSITLMKQTLAKIDYLKISSVAHLGSLVATNKAIYFLSISAGILKFADKSYFAISVSSPIGRLLLGKKVGETISFNGNNIRILTIQ